MLPFEDSEKFRFVPAVGPIDRTGGSILTIGASRIERDPVFGLVLHPWVSPAT